jgi:glycosyltransferase involved in cell wall biosynthesis
MIKKILLISPQPFFQWRGSPIRVAFNALALAELGHRVDLLTLPIGEEKKITGVRVFRVANPLGLRNIPIGPSLAKILFDILILLKGISLCLTNRYDVIHGVEEAGFIGAILAKLIGARAIFEKHSDPFSYKKGLLKNIVLRLYAGVEKLSVKMSDAVICTGPGLVRQVEAMKTTTRAFHIFDIPSSLVDSEESQAVAIRREQQESEDEVIVTFVGSFASYQGVELMFAAIPIVLAQCPNARFIIIGGSAAEIKKQTNKFIKLGIEKHVNFLGKVAPDILPNYLRASDILLSPRASGVNSPLKILDYMKAGRSIVATDIPSNRLMLDEKQAMLTPANPERFALGICTLVIDKQQRKTMGAINFDLYQNKYNFTQYCELMSSCYASVLDKKYQHKIGIPLKEKHALSACVCEIFPRCFIEQFEIISELACFI